MWRVQRAHLVFLLSTYSFDLEIRGQARVAEAISK